MSITDIKGRTIFSVVKSDLRQFLLAKHLPVGRTSLYDSKRVVTLPYTVISHLKKIHEHYAFEKYT